MADNRRIVLRGRDEGYGEGRCDEAMSPGMAIELAADGDYDQVQATQAEALKGVAGLIILIEDSMQGKTVDDAYAADDVIFFYHPVNGEIINILVKSGEAIAVGDTLVVEAAGSGLFVEAAGTETRYCFEAMEGPGTLAANDHVKCRCVW